MNSGIYLSKLRINQGNTLLFKELDLDVKEGQWVEIIGKNNSGKTTLLNALYGLHHDLQGQIKVLDHGLNPISSNFNEVRRKIGFFSNSLPLIQSKTLRANLSLAFSATNQVSELERDSFANGIIDQLGLKDKLLRSIESLSSSEQVLAKISRLLITRPKLIILDCPFRSLDGVSSGLILQVLKEYISSENTTVLICADRATDISLDSRHLFLIENQGLKQIRL